MKRILNRETTNIKAEILETARAVFAGTGGNKRLLQDYHDDDIWRLAYLEGQITLPNGKVAFEDGDHTIARKDEEPGATMPVIVAFSARLKEQIKLRSTDPIAFLED